MGTRFLTGMAKRYVTEQNDRDTPSPVKRMIWQNRKSLRNHSNRVEPEGFFAVIQLQFLAGEIKLACSQSES